MAHKDVLMALDDLIEHLETFRKNNGLSNNLSSYEITTSLTDKLGRICRFVKHTERDDPKENWREEIGCEIFGVITYLVLLVDHYDISQDLLTGAMKEMQKAIDQHSRG